MMIGRFSMNLVSFISSLKQLMKYVNHVVAQYPTYYARFNVRLVTFDL